MEKLILAIETSCDETAASLVKFSETEDDFKIEVLSNAIASQIDIHKEWGGVYPELASRAHLEAMISVLEEAILPISNSKFLISNKNPNYSSSVPADRQEVEKLTSRVRSRQARTINLLQKVDAIAITQGPGLIGSLLMGTQTANILARHFNKPLIAVNHLEGHVYSAFCAENQKSNNVSLRASAKQSGQEEIATAKGLAMAVTIPKTGIFPVLALVVSGGHTSLILMKDHLQYETVGQTVDDAAGEAFDKVSKLMELGYPGGPIIEKLAENGNENAYDLPVAMKDSLDFSFSGLKTAVLYLTKDPRTKKKLEYNQADMAASFQKAVVDALILKTKKAIEKFEPKTLILGGGVSANGYLRERFQHELNFSSLRARAKQSGQEEIAAAPPAGGCLAMTPPNILIPPKNLSTDNAVGIAIVAALKFSKNQTTSELVDAKANFPI